MRQEQENTQRAAGMENVRRNKFFVVSTSYLKQNTVLTMVYLLIYTTQYTCLSTREQRSMALTLGGVVVPATNFCLFNVDFEFLLTSTTRLSLQLS